MSDYYEHPRSETEVEVASATVVTATESSAVFVSFTGYFMMPQRGGKSCCVISQTMYVHFPAIHQIVPRAAGMTQTSSSKCQVAR